MDEPVESGNKSHFSLAQASLGFLIALAAAFLTVMAGVTLRPITASGEISTVKMALIFGVGFVQWVYALPIVFVLMRRGFKSLAGGFFVAALILLSLNLAGLVYITRHPIHI